MTPDTVVKWIKNGWVPARRTAGGHYRIAETDILRVGTQLSPQPVEAAAAEEPQASDRPRQFQYCWEYNSSGQIRPECRECAAYQMRAYRCYEVLKLGPVAHHARVFCQKSCEECDYFIKVHKQPTSVLVVTDNEVLTAALQRDASGAPFNLALTRCEYTCSALIGTFRPDFAVIDCSIGREQSRDITQHILTDPRVPYVRVILAAEQGGFPNECDREVFARIRAPFGIDEIAECLRGVLRTENRGPEK